MNARELQALLEQVAAGALTADDALATLTGGVPDADLGFARVDHDRATRCGFPEVIFAPGKSADQVLQIFGELTRHGDRVLVSRADGQVAEAVLAAHPQACYHEAARAITWRRDEDVERIGGVAVVAAGTADIPIAEEARLTAAMMDAHTESHYDVGVAGLHRLLRVRGALARARAVVVVAGMEGALASVVGGLIDRPVIAVPTSVGYGASFGGLAALLAMLNSCAAGVSVVNIDNGFGAGYAAGLINRGSERDAGLPDGAQRRKEGP